MLGPTWLCVSKRVGSVFKWVNLFGNSPALRCPGCGATVSVDLGYCVVCRTTRPPVPATGGEDHRPTVSLRGPAAREAGAAPGSVKPTAAIPCEMAGGRLPAGPAPHPWRNHATQEGCRRGRRAAPAFAAPAHPTTVHAVADSGAFYHG